MRSTAKWLLATLAAIGGVLVAGLQLSPLGHLETWRLAVAVSSAGLALAAVTFMIVAVAGVLTDEWVTLSQLDDEAIDIQLDDNPERSDRRRLALLRELRAKIESEAQCLYKYVASSIGDLYKAQRTANEALRTEIDSGSPRIAEAVARVDFVGAAIREATDCANYHRTRLLFERLRRQLTLASSIAIVAVIVFAYAANPPKELAEPIQVQLVPAPSASK